MTQAHEHTPSHGQGPEHPEHSHGTHPEHSHDEHSDAGQAEILDLDAEVLSEHIASITAWLPLKGEPHQIVDLGCGTGAGTFALLERFPDAHVTAVDTSAEHLRLLREKACARDVEGRVRTVQADLDSDRWPDLGRPDLVWASASMHHMAHPDRTLARVRELLAPGGLFAVVELAGFPRFLPAGAPANRPGLEERAHAATDAFHAEHVPHRGADWGPMLTAAGFAVEDERTISVDIDGARSDAIGRYAHGSMQRIRGVAAPALSAEDLTALDELLDTDNPNSLLHRKDLAVRTERTVWAARRT
ncbi:trans-aconitate 2-methyltransferase [Streptomyces sp. NBC_00083]|uniref:class I SAM-dependent methyltransferase n=1 Tax=Streptomyces sp. NBC_00083 TaxID=2975647 RepID=UPI002257B901|nr:class I SAM-dependent methyltransferase [Streptomyces sp. NBC_00083]MCX5387384.1 class I SAM-dependent methyltransferase [Streptomyces sp. NBC_00083]